MTRTTNGPLDAVVAGHICLDIIPAFVSGAGGVPTLRPGTLVKVGSAVLSTGGAVSNTGIVLGNLGARVALMGAVGRDLFGDGIRAIVRGRTGDDSGMKVVREGSSSYTVVLAVPGVDRIFLHHPGTNDTFGYDDIDFSLVRRARLFHLGYPTLMRRLYLNEGAELVRIYRKVKELGVATSLDMALPDPASEAGKVRWDRILRKLMPYLDLFLPSFEEIVFMADRPRYERLKRASRSGDPMETMQFADAAAVAQRLIEWGGTVVLIKCSVRGLYLRTAGAGRISPFAGRMGISASAWADRELIGASFKVRRICLLYTYPSPRDS